MCIAIYLHFTGKPYGKLSKRQKQRKLAKIKAKTTQYLKGLQKTVLTATGLQFQSVEGRSINVQLNKENVRPAQAQETVKTCNEKNKTLLHTLMRNNISFSVYHELAMIFPELPRSHQIASYLAN